MTVTIDITPPAGLEAGSTYEAELRSGGEIIRTIILNAEQTSVEVSVTGIGNMTFELFYQGSSIGSKAVNFTGNG